MNVGADEFFRAEDGAVDVTFGGEVHERARLNAAEEAGDESAIIDVSMHKFVAGMVGDGKKVRRVAGVSKVVEVDDAGGFLPQPLENEVAADESRTSGNDDCV